MATRGREKKRTNDGTHKQREESRYYTEKDSNNGFSVVRRETCQLLLQRVQRNSHD